MEEIIITFVLIPLADGIREGVEKGVEYAIRKVVDSFGRTASELYYSVDTDGDGVADEDVVFYTLEYQIPNLDGNYSIVSNGDTVGVGLPLFEIIDGTDLGSYIDLSDPFDYPTLTGNGAGYLADLDYDGEIDSTLVPLQDFTGDGAIEWGRVVDDDENGIPDASPEAAYYPVGSDGYNQIIASVSNQPSIIVMSDDGTMTVYDTNGQITAEDCDTAYSLWVSENGIMNKPLDNYSVTEGLLLILFLVSACYFVKSLFKRKDVYR